MTEQYVSILVNKDNYHHMIGGAGHSAADDAMTRLSVAFNTAGGGSAAFVVAGGAPPEAAVAAADLAAAPEVDMDPLPTHSAADGAMTSLSGAFGTAGSGSAAFVVASEAAPAAVDPVLNTLHATANADAFEHLKDYIHFFHVWMEIFNKLGLSKSDSTQGLYSDCLIVKKKKKFFGTSSDINKKPWVEWTQELFKVKDTYAKIKDEYANVEKLMTGLGTNNDFAKNILTPSITANQQYFIEYITESKKIKLKIEELLKPFFEDKIKQANPYLITIHLANLIQNRLGNKSQLAKVVLDYLPNTFNFVKKNKSIKIQFEDKEIITRIRSNGGKNLNTVAVLQLIGEQLKTSSDIYMTLGKVGNIYNDSKVIGLFFDSGGIKHLVNTLHSIPDFKYPPDENDFFFRRKQPKFLESLKNIPSKDIDLINDNTTAQSGKFDSLLVEVLTEILSKNININNKKNVNFSTLLLELSSKLTIILNMFKQNGKYIIACDKVLEKHTINKSDISDVLNELVDNALINKDELKSYLHFGLNYKIPSSNIKEFLEDMIGGNPNFFGGNLQNIVKLYDENIVNSTTLTKKSLYNYLTDCGSAATADPTAAATAADPVATAAATTTSITTYLASSNVALVTHPSTLGLGAIVPPDKNAVMLKYTSAPDTRLGSVVGDKLSLEAESCIKAIKSDENPFENVEQIYFAQVLAGGDVTFHELTGDSKLDSDNAATGAKNKQDLYTFYKSYLTLTHCHKILEQLVDVMSANAIFASFNAELIKLDNTVKTPDLRYQLVGRTIMSNTKNYLASFVLYGALNRIGMYLENAFKPDTPTFTFKGLDNGDIFQKSPKLDQVKYLDVGKVTAKDHGDFVNTEITLPPLPDDYAAESVGLVQQLTAALT